MSMANFVLIWTLVFEMSIMIKIKISITLANQAEKMKHFQGRGGQWQLDLQPTNPFHI